MVKQEDTVMGADSGGGGEALRVFRFGFSILFNSLLFLIRGQKGNQQQRRLGGGKQRWWMRIRRWS